jgi:hypothetical protein
MYSAVGITTEATTVLEARHPVGQYSVRLGPSRSPDTHPPTTPQGASSPVVAMSGWQVHHPAPQFLIDTTNMGWTLLSGQTWIPPFGHQWVRFHAYGQAAFLAC